MNKVNLNYKAMLGGEKGKEVVFEKDTMKWAEWFEKADRHVGKNHVGDVFVSTVFLAIDHGFRGMPLWFETMIFGGEFDGRQDRYATWVEGELGHLKWLDKIRGK